MFSCSRLQWTVHFNFTYYYLEKNLEINTHIIILRRKHIHSITAKTLAAKLPAQDSGGDPYLASPKLWLLKLKSL